MRHLRSSLLLGALASALALGSGAGIAAAEPAPAPKVDLAALVKDPAAFEKHLAYCATQGYGGANHNLMAELGKIERIEPLAGRRVTEQVHVFGK